MSRKFFRNDRGINVGNLAADPSDGIEGSFYYNTVSKVLRLFADGAWEDVGSADALTTTDNTATGSNANLANPGTLVIALTNASLVSIDTIITPADTQLIILTNRTGSQIIINDDTGATSANRIRTGTGASIIVSNNASVELVYNSTAARWMVIGGAGTGAGSEINWISPSDGSATTGYAVYQDAAGTSPVDGTGGTPTVTFTNSTSNPLRGLYSYLFSKPASNCQGQGWSKDFTIDSGYINSPVPQSIRMIAKIASGTYADGDMTFWIVDKTSGQVIQPSAYLLLNASGAQQLMMEFQPNFNSGDYRLCGHVSSTSASAYTIQFDEISISPNTYTSGAMITPWVRYTPVTVGLGTPSSTDVYSRRVGDSLEIRGFITPGSPSATAVQIGLGFNGVSGGLTIDSAKAAGTIVGALSIATANSTYYHWTLIASPGNSYVNVGFQSPGTSSVAAVSGTGFGITTGIQIQFYASVPITGWGTSQVLSSETSTRVVALNVTSPTNSPSGAGSVDVLFGTVGTDTHGAYNAATGVWTCPVSGQYQISSLLTVNATATSANSISRLDILVNGSAVTSYTLIAAITANQDRSLHTSKVIALTAGQQVKVNYACLYGGSPGFVAGINSNNLCIERIAGPAQIAASEKVYASYYKSSTTSVTAGNVINYDTKVYDSHNAVTVGASWVFTAPRPGIYSFKTYTELAVTGVVMVYKNLAAYKRAMYMAAGSPTDGAFDVFLNAGETVDLRPTVTGNVVGGAMSSNSSWIDITSQG